jgi:hypothetical protein
MLALLAGAPLQVDSLGSERDPRGGGEDKHALLSEWDYASVDE